MTTKAPRPLTPKQEAFCQAYVDCGVAVDAARQAGYRQPESYGLQLLRKTTVQARLEELRAETRAQVSFKRLDAVERLLRVIEADITDVVSFGPDGVTLKDSAQLSKSVTFAIDSVAQTQHGVRVKMANKLQAIEQLVRLLGLDTEGDLAEKVKTRVALWAELQGPVRVMIEECS